MMSSLPNEGALNVRLSNARDQAFRQLMQAFMSVPDEALGKVQYLAEQSLPQLFQGGLATPGENINDGSRLQRALGLMDQGMRKHPAARQACREDPAGANEEACERRLIRKLTKRLDPNRLP